MPRLYFTLLLTLVLAGCAKKKDVLAKIGDKELNRTEFAAYLKYKHAPKDEKSAQKALEEYLDHEALAQSIEQQKLLDQESIKVELGEFRKEMLISRYFEAFLDQKVSDEAINNYYRDHSKDYGQVKVHAAHILLRTNPRMTDVERRAKETTARDIYAKLQGGADFAALAKEQSEDRVSSQNGGDLGWIKQGGIHPTFSKIVFEQKVGVLSEPFETPFGFHIVKVLEGPQTVKLPLQSVFGDIRYELRQKAKEAELKRLKSVVAVKRTDNPILVDGPTKATPGAKGDKANPNEQGAGDSKEAELRRTARAKVEAQLARSQGSANRTEGKNSQ